MPSVKRGSGIDSVMTGVPAVPGFASSPGEYNEGSGLGPKGVDGGVPLKFTDGSISSKGTKPIQTTMTPEAMKSISDKTPGGTTIDSPMSTPKK